MDGPSGSLAKFRQAMERGLDPGPFKFYYYGGMVKRWNILLSRIIAAAVFFLSLVLFIDRGNFWLAIIVPPPLSVIVMFLTRRLIP